MLPGHSWLKHLFSSLVLNLQRPRWLVLACLAVWTATEVVSARRPLRKVSLTSKSVHAFPFRSYYGPGAFKLFTFEDGQGRDGIKVSRSGKAGCDNIGSFLVRFESLHIYDGKRVEFVDTVGHPRFRPLSQNLPTLSERCSWDLGILFSQKSKASSVACLLIWISW